MKIKFEKFEFDMKTSAWVLNIKLKFYQNFDENNSYFF